MGEATKKAEDLAGNTWQHCEFLLAFCLFFSLSISADSFASIFIPHVVMGIVLK